MVGLAREHLKFVSVPASKKLRSMNWYTMWHPIRIATIWQGLLKILIIFLYAKMNTQVSGLYIGRYGESTFLGWRIHFYFNSS